MKQATCLVWMSCVAAAFMLASPRAISQASLDMRWDAGSEDCAEGQGRVQAHAIDDTTIAIRQNPCVDYEAPLMYLLIGTERALLIDSGATEDARITAQLTELVSNYLGNSDGSRLPLVVAHTHGHQDHRSGDAAFAALPGTTVVSHEGAAMRAFFGLEDWPNGSVRFELGQRPVEIIPTPGHHEDHVVFLDSRTRLLFSGDFVLPGRLLVEDIAAYRESASRVLEPAQAYGTQYALGAHIEMDTQGELYSSGATHHPDERGVALPFGMDEVRALREDLDDFNGFYSRHPNYTIVNPVHNLIALLAGALAALSLVFWGVRRHRRRRTVS